MRVLLPLLLLLAVSPGFARPEASAPGRTGTAVEGFAVTVSDLERSLDFYTGVLGFEKLSETEVAGGAWERLFGVFPVRLRVARLRLGAEQLDLLHFLAPEGRPMPRDSRGNDLWFQHIALAVRDMEAAYAHLRKHRVRHASSGPQRLPDWNPKAGGIEAFYFKDPDGHFLEAIRFPPGKGDPRWQEPSKRLFLGIDHTAITVSDTEAALRHYRDALGLEPRGESENHGEEQERLNGVFGARLRITLLRGASGPGVELLEYLAPEGGRRVPGDGSASDLWHWHLRLRVPSAGEASGRALRSGRWVSPGSVRTDGALGFGEGAMVRDGDGHAALLAEERR